MFIRIKKYLLTKNINGVTEKIIPKGINKITHKIVKKIIGKEITNKEYIIGKDIKDKAIKGMNYVKGDKKIIGKKGKWKNVERV